MTTGGPVVGKVGASPTPFPSVLCLCHTGLHKGKILNVSLRREAMSSSLFLPQRVSLKIQYAQHEVALLIL